MEEVTKDEMAYAEGMWEITKEDAEKGEESGQLLWQIINTYYPGKKEAQVRALGFLKQAVTDWRGRIPKNETLNLARRWGVESMLVKELLHFVNK